MSDYILKLTNISKHFGGVRALENVHLNVKKGEIHALVGENGAGKSTLMKVLSGVYQPTSGSIEFNGEIIKFSNPLQAREVGIGIIYQEFSLIPDLKVYQNIFLGREIKKKNGVLDSKKMIKIASEKLKDLDVDINPKDTVRNLSIAKQQFCEIVKAVTDDLKILILDEPTATLTPGEVFQLFSLMRRLQDRGVTMIFISHHLDDIYTIAENVTVFRDGQFIGTSKVSDIKQDQLINMMVGRTVSQEFPQKPSVNEVESWPVCLDVEIQRLSTTTKQCIKLRRGEILGVAGLVGAGRTELFRALIGADKAYFKKIIKNGQEIKLRNPNEALFNGIGLVPEDRKTQGLILPFSIKDNIVINSLEKEAKAKIFENKKANIKISDSMVKKINIKTPSIYQYVRNLSGGNQQKVAIAKWLTTDCDVIIFDEPTRGVDVGAKAEIYELIRELAKQGLSIIMISSEMPEVVGLSDRVITIKDDKIVAELKGKQIDPEVIMSYATGGIK
ncbi:MAG: sugar ABC transporter ATP-binding protein [Pleomorphochaeta sp.]